MIVFLANMVSTLLDDFQLHEEKIAAIQEKLELAEQKLAQYSKLPEIEEQLKQRMEALTQVRPQVRGSQLTFICNSLFLCVSSYSHHSTDFLEDNIYYTRKLDNI